jgi:predicted phosphoribosyltransferase
MWPPEEERFEDRCDAGRVLSQAIAEHLGATATAGSAITAAPLVVGLPHGGVPVAVEVARALGADFDLVLTTRIGLPWQPDVRVGAIAEGGPPVFDRDALACVGLTVGELGPAVQRSRLELRRRNDFYRGRRQMLDAAGRTVIVVDDGLATCVIARAAVRAIREHAPARLIYAAPVCAAETHDWLADEADAVIDLHRPREFYALGLFYRDFAQVTNDEVRQASTMMATPVVSP